MKIARIVGYVLLSLGLLARLFVPGMSANGAILAALGGLVVAATVAADSNRKRG